MAIIAAARPSDGPGTGTVATAMPATRTASAIAPSSTQDRLRMSRA